MLVSVMEGMLGQVGAEEKGVSCGHELHGKKREGYLLARNSEYSANLGPPAQKGPG